MIYEIWIRCNDECPEPQPGGLRKLMILEDKEQADHFAASLRDMFHTAEIREVEV